MFWKLLFLIITGFASLSLNAQVISRDGTAPRFRSLSSRDIKWGRIDPNEISVYLAPIGHSPVFTWRADVNQKAASVVKMMTTFAGLAFLGKDYRWNTDFYTDGRISRGSLKGNLYWRGGADPGFSTENLNGMVQALKTLGIQTIEGDIILDTSRLASLDTSSERVPKTFAIYQIPPDALSLDGMLMSITILPDKANRRWNVIKKPDLPSFKVINNLKWLNQSTCSRGLMGYVNATRTSRSVTLSGSVPGSCVSSETWMPALDHSSYQTESIAWLLGLNDLSLKGSIKSGITPSGSKLLVRYESDKTLSEQLIPMNVNSNNTVARMIFLSLGLDTISPIDSANAKLFTLLKLLQIPTPPKPVDNGAGLSYEFEVSARTLGLMMQSAWLMPWRDEFFNSMPQPGINGTLRRRFREATWFKGAMKTGTLSDVKAIGGIWNEDNGQNWILIVTLNTSKKGEAKTRSLGDFDRFVIELLQSVRSDVTVNALR